MANETNQTKVEEDEYLEIPSSWEFRVAPSATEVAEKLSTLPAWHGVRPVEFLEFVQPLSQKKNVSQDPEVKDYQVVWTLYFTVAGRVAMLNAAAEANGWRVDFVPEPVTPTGIPGMLEYGDRIVYREYVEIYAQYNDGSERLIGRRPGTAWVPGEGGAGAVKSNRFEKVETSARGRAIAGWGFGVLPGSGVASLDEMLSVKDLNVGGGQQSQRRSATRTQVSRDDVISELRVALATFQELAQVSDEVMDDKIGQYTERTFNKKLPRTEAGAFDFTALKDGELVLFLQRMQQQVIRMRTESEGV